MIIECAGAGGGSAAAGDEEDADGVGWTEEGAASGGDSGVGTICAEVGAGVSGWAGT